MSLCLSVCVCVSVSECLCLCVSVSVCLCSTLQCYTTVGLALARVTVVDRLCDIVYDTLVRPPHPIVDYNTRFSGLTAQHFTSDVTTSLTDVQAQLLSMVSMETILLGHSLDSDLRALKVCVCHACTCAGLCVGVGKLAGKRRACTSKLWLHLCCHGSSSLYSCCCHGSSSPYSCCCHGSSSSLYSCHQVIHSRVVDTALVFPHRLGPPYKKALKTLAAQYLGKIIQDSAGKDM